MHLNKIVPPIENLNSIIKFSSFVSIIYYVDFLARFRWKNFSNIIFSSTTRHLILSRYFNKIQSCSRNSCECFSKTFPASEITNCFNKVFTQPKFGSLGNLQCFYSLQLGHNRSHEQPLQVAYLFSFKCTLGLLIIIIIIVERTERFDSFSFIRF